MSLTDRALHTKEKSHRPGVRRRNEEDDGWPVGSRRHRVEESVGLSNSTSILPESAPAFLALAPVHPPRDGESDASWFLPGVLDWGPNAMGLITSVSKALRYVRRSPSTHQLSKMNSSSPSHQPKLAEESENAPETTRVHISARNLFPALRTKQLGDLSPVSKQRSHQEISSRQEISLIPLCPPSQV